MLGWDNVTPKTDLVFNQFKTDILPVVASSFVEFVVDRGSVEVLIVFVAGPVTHLIGMKMSQ